MHLETQVLNRPAGPPDLPLLLILDNVGGFVESCGSCEGSSDFGLCIGAIDSSGFNGAVIRVVGRMNSLREHAVVPGFQEDPENHAAGAVPWKDSRGRADGRSKLPTNIANPAHSPRTLKPGNDLVRRALGPKRGSCRLMQNAVVSFGEVKLGDDGPREERRCGGSAGSC